MKRVRIYVTGRVQGVFFRVYTRDFAKNLAIGGYVKNLRDGRVEIVAEGSESSLRTLADWVKNKGSPYSQVHHTEEQWEDVSELEFKSFQITH
ncbi:MAG: acylphosphatase [Candidatus Heimdallarchaeota archaeon]|nr:MAG: acylphosphatase [Candidatus Heimdallarchaeota archaeon]